MKYVYVIKKLKDIHNIYKGIDDVEVHVYTTKTKAVKKLKELHVRALEHFRENGTDNISEFENVYEKYYFHVNDGREYISAEIQELRLN